MQDQEIENMSNIIVGLDIGTTKIAVMVGRKNKYGKLEILATAKAVSSSLLFLSYVRI